MMAGTRSDVTPIVMAGLLSPWHARSRHGRPCAGIQVFFTNQAHHPRMGGWVYIMTNRPNGTLYIGVTSDLIRRVWEHREKIGSSFVRRYDLTRLVYFEHHDDPRRHSAGDQPETLAQRGRSGYWPPVIRIGMIFARLCWVEDVDGRHTGGHDDERDPPA